MHSKHTEVNRSLFYFFKLLNDRCTINITERCNGLGSDQPVWSRHMCVSVPNQDLDFQFLCHGLFLCSLDWGKMWLFVLNCWLSLFKLSFHNILHKRKLDFCKGFISACFKFITIGSRRSLNFLPISFL